MFGYTNERRLIPTDERTMRALIENLSHDDHMLALSTASIPDMDVELELTGEMHNPS